MHSNNTLEKWEEQTLGEICEKISAGGDKPDIFSDIKTDTCCIPIYSNGIKGNGLYGYTDKATIDKPAITVSARGTIGYVCKRLQPYCPIVRLISLIPKDYIDLSFLAYAMNLIVPQNTGTSIPQLTVPILKTNKIKYPSIEEQQRIVGILDKAFENIEKAKQNTLQNLNNAKELFENCIENNFTNLTSLYPIKTLSDIAVIKGGKRLPKGQKLTKEITEHPYLRVTDFTIDGTINTDDLHYISDNIYEQIKNYTITSKDLYITIVGATIGKSGIIPKELDGANLTENACKLIFNMDVCNKYVYYFTKTKSFNEQSFGNTKITAVPKLALTRLATIKLPVPNLPKQQKIVVQLDELQEQTKRLEQIYTQKLQDLDELKQSILQKAFNGEL